MSSLLTRNKKQDHSYRRKAKPTRNFLSSTCQHNNFLVPKVPYSQAGALQSHALIKQSLQNLAQKTCEDQVMRNLARPSPLLSKMQKKPYAKNPDLPQPVNVIAHYSQPAQPKQKAQQAIMGQQHYTWNSDISEIECSQQNVIDFGPSVEIFDDNKAEESLTSSILKDVLLKETLDQNRGESRRYSERVHAVTVEEENSHGQLVARTFSDTQKQLESANDFDLLGDPLKQRIEMLNEPSDSEDAYSPEKQPYLHHDGFNKRTQRLSMTAAQSFNSNTVNSYNSVQVAPDPALAGYYSQN